MEENIEKKKSGEKADKGSNSCVIDLSIEGGNGAEETEKNEKNDNNEIDNTTSLNKSFDDFLNFTKKLNLKDNIENILDEDNLDEQNNNIRAARSKTFMIMKSSNKKAPKPKPIIIDEYIKPISLNRKKSIIRDNSQKDIIECKSLDDLSDNEKNFLNYDSNEDSEEDDKCTLKINKIKNENKKVFFDFKINCKYYNEYENILNIEKIFWKNVNNSIYEDILIGKNKNIENKNKKKRKFWHKHINVFKKKLSSPSIKYSDDKNDISEYRKKRSDTFHKKNNYEGLFILGVLESAAKEKKRRKTIHIKKKNNKSNNNNNKTEDDKKNK
jgi:hypothetical protein